MVNFEDLTVMSSHITKNYDTFEGCTLICQDEATKWGKDNLKNFGFINGKVVTSEINEWMN